MPIRQLPPHVNANTKMELQSDDLEKAGTKTREEDAKKILCEIWEEVGEFGAWQWFLAGINILMTIVTGLQTNSYAMLVGSSTAWTYACVSNNDSNFSIPKGLQSCFALSDPDMRCSESENYHMVYSHEYYDTTLTTEFDLMCGYESYLAALVHSAFTIGCFFGVIIFGWFSDRCGRKTAISVGVPCFICLNFSLSLSPNIYVFLLLRFLQGIAVFGTFTIAYIMSMETTAPSKRAMIGNIVHIPWGLQFISVAVIAMFVKHWRVQQVVFSLPSLLCVICLTPWLNESPRWLAIKGKIDQATKVFLVASKWNRREVSEKQIKEKLQLFHKLSSYDPNAAGISNFSFTSGLIRTPQMRRRILLSAVIWFQVAFVNHGFNIYAPTLARNPFLAYSLVGLFELAGPIVGAFVFTYGRRIPLSFIFSLCACLSLSIVAIFKIWPENHEYQLMAIILTVSFLSDMAFNGVYVHVSEMMPTTHRSFGLGACSSVARIGSSLSSVTIQAANTYKFLPPVLFGFLAFTGSFCNFLLPSTERKQLPETIEDVENERTGEEIHTCCCDPSPTQFQEKDTTYA